MAPKVIDYGKSVIYKIEHIDSPELLYVGSTTDFIRRKSQHKQYCNNINEKAYNCKLYRLIRDNGNWDSFKCMIIKEFPCNNRTELIIEEEKYRKELQKSLNTLKSHRTIEEKKDYQKHYHEVNKEQISEMKKEKLTCSCGSIFRISNKSHHEKTLKHINFINN